MECECISPPPEFDIPSPPDPSLIWHLLSDEFVTDEFTQIQQCDANEKIQTQSEVSLIFSNLSNYLLYALFASGVLISAALLVIIICIRIRRFNRNGRAKMKRKTEFSADIILNSSDWPYTTTIHDSNSVINGDLLYGSTENNFMKHKAIRVTSNSLRSYPCHLNKLSTNSMRNSSLQSGPVFRLRGSTDGYSTIGRLYEEIPGNEIFNSVHGIKHSENSLAYVSRRELLSGLTSVRRPPPTCRPPPPPSQHSPLSLDSSGNSAEKEHEEHDVMPVSSPKRLTDDEKSRNSGNSGDNGHESGYGTAPSRSWNSPLIMHQQKRMIMKESDDAFHRQTPLTIYAYRSSNTHPITYV
ncbi:Uncharacterized protein BM_BM9755 [Brugia malayi]|uniref:Bm9755 n=2 Tax=Brugia malayi TaxID=6279 RepID=A0A4E9FLV3_BRUMA|nr:Uncharacterized protein BM_BM9755 [Brugia malayi]VIO97576.1 Uncharacterized protein BM_BM9755 [Brugia malayi]